MLGKIIGEKIYCGLDIGGQGMKAALVQARENKKIELLGVYEHKTYGYKDGSVSNLAEFSDCIHTTLQGLIKKIGCKLKDVSLGVNGELIDIRESSALIPLVDKGSKMISTGDIKRINHQARLLGTKTEEEIVHEFPQHYYLDDVNSIINPLGLYGRKMGVRSLLVVTPANRIRNIIQAVNEAGYDVNGVQFTSYMASCVSLDEQERKDGCAFLDIGSKVTSILIFKDGILRGVYKIAVGGNHFTSQIARQLNLPFELAEDIKKSYAVAFYSDQLQKEEILVKKENNYMPIKREVIYKAIEEEIKKLVESIHGVLQKSGYYEQLNRGITVVGGGALFPGLMELIEKQTNLPVQLGKIKSISLGQLTHTVLFASVIGLAQESLKKSFVVKMAVRDRLQLRRIVLGKIRQVYEEYF